MARLPPPAKAVLVAEADQAVGRATAQRLAEHGHRVLACARGREGEGMDDLPRETMRGGLIEVAELDLASEESCRGAVAEAVSLFGRLDAVVHGGHPAGFGAVEEMPDETITRVFAAHFFGPLRLIRAAIPTMRAQGAGRLVAVASAGGRIAMPLSGAFCAAQYAIEGLCDALRLELADFGIQVVLIEPALMRRAAVTQAREIDHRDLGVAASSPYARIAEPLVRLVKQGLRRATTPQEVAGVIERALLAPRPRARYAVTRRTAALLWARKVLPDRFLDGRLARALRLRD
jgi:NAD(P)-dependent dehydrogenase (short-subunit alcohol dehydrogenase family)